MKCAETRRLLSERKRISHRKEQLTKAYTIWDRHASEIVLITTAISGLVFLFLTQSFPFVFEYIQISCFAFGIGTLLVKLEKRYIQPIIDNKLQETLDYIADIDKRITSGNSGIT